MDIIIRELPETTVKQLDELASKAGMSRNAFLRQRLEELAQASGIPMRWGEGFKAFTQSGGTATIRLISNSIQHGASRLNQEEFQAYQRACLVADPRNGGRWEEARQLLEAAGFEVFNT